MALRFSYCPYRLLFKHPFGTAHGVRTGTDSVFIRVEADGVTGYGEATLPPYLTEKVPEVIERLHAFTRREHADLHSAIRTLDDPAYTNAPGFRNAVHMALLDALSKKYHYPVNQLIECTHSKLSIVLMTLGLTTEMDIPQKLAELPWTAALKVKVDKSSGSVYVNTIKSLTNRKLFIDANQGLENVPDAMDLVRAAGADLVGLEQPFGKDQWAAHAELTKVCGTAVYGDESIQAEGDLDRAAQAFSGVNIKLMKCGGLDRAAAIARRAEVLGMRIMLGSMSESALGCTAMAHLADMADVVDLDGPWLIMNDPFTGIGLKDGQLVMPEGPGIGARLKADLQFLPSGEAAT
ncbi:MAG: enolase C-terminal domain-like protein [Flavobacteriales bacterium]